MLDQGFSLKESQFLSPAKQELTLTGILCNSRELRDWAKCHRMKVEVEIEKLSPLRDMGD